MATSYSSTATTSPSWTVWPSWTLISLTAPARGASTGISIFMDSRTITASPAATRSPGLAAIWNTTPVMCALISSAIERSLFNHLRVHPSHTERVAREGATEERHRRFHALDARALERRRHPLDRLGARGAASDELEQQRVVVDRDRAARLDAGLDPDPLARGQLEPFHPAWRGQETFRRVLSIHSALDRGVARRDLLLAPGQPLARGDKELRHDEVEPGRLLGHRVLDLKPRSHLEEVEAARRVHEELHRPRVDVVDRPCSRDRRAREAIFDRRRQIRRRRLLDQLLVATTLDRTVALVEMDDGSRAGAEHLDLDVPGRAWSPWQTPRAAPRPCPPAPCRCLRRPPPP